MLNNDGRQLICPATSYGVHRYYCLMPLCNEVRSTASREFILRLPTIGSDSARPFLYRLPYRHPKIRRTICYRNAGRPQCGDLFLGRTAAAADDRAGVTHALARWRRLTGNKCRHRLGDVLLDEFRRTFLGGSANPPPSQNALGLPVRLGHLLRYSEPTSGELI